MKEPKKIIQQKLYGGKIVVNFTEDGHTYTIGGRRPPSVTTVINVLDKSRALIPWAVGEYSKYLRPFIGETLTEDHIITGEQQHKIRKEEAANVGSSVHAWIEKFVKGQKPEMPELREAQIGVNAFMDWTNSNKVKFISSERIVYSKKYDFLGKLDIEAKVNGELCLIDIKTSNGIYNSYFLQTAAYAQADTEESKRKYAGRWIIRLAKETEHEYHKRMADKGKTTFPEYQVFEAKFLDSTGKEMKRDYAGFLACLELYRWNKETDVWPQ